MNKLLLSALLFIPGSPCMRAHAGVHRSPDTVCQEWLHEKGARTVGCFVTIDDQKKAIGVWQTFNAKGQLIEEEHFVDGRSA